MGFNKRFLSEESIRKTAKLYENQFQWFQRYMVYADGYIIEDKWSSKIHEEFCDARENSEERKKIHEKILKGEL